MASTVTETDGFTIDLTDPKMVHLGDGDVVGKDRMYSVCIFSMMESIIFSHINS